MVRDRKLGSPEFRLEPLIVASSNCKYFDSRIRRSTNEVQPFGVPIGCPFSRLAAPRLIVKFTFAILEDNAFALRTMDVRLGTSPNVGR
jgi:hypothetical protein